MSAVEFTIPGAPQGKGRARVGLIAGKARMFTPGKTVAYEGLIAHAAAEAMRGRSPFLTPVFVTIHIHSPVPASWSKKKQIDAHACRIVPASKPDADNVVKAVFDGCNGVVFRDDVQVVDLFVRKRYSDRPRVDVVVREYVNEMEPQVNLLELEPA